MKLFAAGPEPAELQRCAEEGLCEGAAVLGGGALDPSGEARGRLAALGRACAGPVLVEVALGDEAALAAAALGRALAQLGPQFAARLPFSAGAATFAACKAAGVKTNAYACATTEEALAAGRAGASWVSPALTGAAPGAASGADYDRLRKTRALLKSFGLGTELLLGPLRDEGAVFDATVMGAGVILASPAVLRAVAARRAPAAQGS
jgi:hypothetical protein